MAPTEDDFMAALTAVQARDRYEALMGLIALATHIPDEVHQYLAAAQAPKGAPQS